ncbi:MAG: 16S rRNA (adenine(1518)-N(6)/adenine(1519)-N(6))-dimethyltransferase RsmA [Alphaproteobacteria bacterium]|nr:16S rRNA (adenine(1518)-N(6)/adenine(1519)-N(6))-dimethyltransferase RsmA [Alphaproteobacteria bacterium]
MTHRPSLKEVMVRHNLLPKKSLGQNFLLDENITHKVAAAAGDLKGRRVIEIGPGPGGLTRAILDLGAAEVIAIEMDPTCVTALQELNEDRLTVLHQDALKTDFAEILCTDRPTKIIANLPYNIGTELLFKWLPLIERIESLTLMFQKEVVDRIVAVPSTKDYGRLSVMVQWLANAKKVFDLPPHVFTPAPKVTSSVVHIVSKGHPLTVEFSRMESLVKQAFSMRRKMLKSTLKGIDPNIFAVTEIDPTRRAETLTVQEFIALALALNNSATTL